MWRLSEIKLPAIFPGYCLFLLVIFLLSGCGFTEPIYKSKPKSKEPSVAESDTLQKGVQPPIKKVKKKSSVPVKNPLQIPDTPREMRAAWIATVADIDWPSAPGLPVAEQKQELIDILNRARMLNLNAVILQVRPAADALYDSPYEPWSEFLTGKQGRPPKPYYDPLKFAVKEAHKRGLELHAWFNPFRAYHFTEKSDFALSHIKNKHPGWVVKYGRYYWINPGKPEARRYSRQVILDVARRYDIDGIHLDDYFYPYAELTANGSKIPFPDDQSYQKYVTKYGPMSRDGWRRQNINRFVKTLHDSLKSIKPKLLFGISPFGIWRPGHPAEVTGYDAYANIYADARKWLREGWVDYLSPQLYWSVDNPGQRFPVLLRWWQQQNVHNRHLWPGIYTSRVGNEWTAEEIEHQIQLTRKQTGATGNIHFSMRPLMENEGNIDRRLLEHEYAQPALIPATPWISTKAPKQPNASIKNTGDQLVISLQTKQKTNPWLWVLKIKYGDSWSIYIYPGWTKSQAFPPATANGRFEAAAISTVNRLSNESTPQMLLPVMEHLASK